MSSKPSLSPSADWTATVEGAVRSEFVRRRSWLRVYLGVLLLLMVATLALLGLGILDVTEVRRNVEPALAATQRIEATNVLLARGQETFDARLREAEAQLAALAKEIKAQPAAQPAPTTAAAPTARKRRPAGPTPLERTVAQIDERLQRVEAAASAADADRMQIHGQLIRLDQAVNRLGAAIGPQSAP